jgi:glutathione S-transferase
MQWHDRLAGVLGEVNKVTWLEDAIAMMGNGQDRPAMNRPCQNSPMSDLVLHGLTRSVYTRIARLALEEKGVLYHLEEVEIFGPQGVPDEHLQRHPFGRIPTLQHGDFMLYETAAITRYVDEAFDGPALQPREPRARARMNQLIGVLDAYAYRPMVWDVFVQRMRVPAQGGRTDEGIVARALPKVATCLGVLAAQLAERPFLVGDALTLGDLHAAPMLLTLAQAPEGQALLAQHAELGRWLAAMAERRSVQATPTT